MKNKDLLIIAQDTGDVIEGVIYKNDGGDEETEYWLAPRTYPMRNYIVDMYPCSEYGEIKDGYISAIPVRVENIGEATAVYGED
jgi:hypothetical protein